jgi:hypothetical protein
MLSEIKKFVNFKNPLFRFFLFLTAFTAISTWDIHTKDTLRNIALCGGLGFALYYIARYVLKIPTINPFNMAITTLLVYLLVHPTNEPLLFFLVFVGIFVGKYFFRFMNLPVFNPTAFGLFFALYLSKVLLAMHLVSDSLLISWWGADMQQQALANMPIANIIVAVVLLLGFVYFTQAFRKFNYAVTFFLTFIFCFFLYNLLVTKQPSETIQIVAQAFFNSVAFLALVMIPEPKTSPSMPTQHIVIGMLSGLALFLYSTIFVRFVAEPFITTILTANLMTFYVKQKKLFQ